MAESASVGDTVISLVITEATPTNVIIAAGNGDSIFAVSSAGVITVASTTNLDYETTTSYTLSIIAYNAQSSDVADVTINIVDANDAPSAGNDATGALTEDASTSTATGTITGTDQDGDTLTYSGATTGTYGAIALSGATWTYTLDNSDADTTALDAGDTVTDSFTMTVSDGTASDTMTVTITITGADDATSAGPDQTGSVTEDASTSTVTGTVATVEPDGDASVSYSVGSSSGTYGSLATVSYTHLTLPTTLIV